MKLYIIGDSFARQRKFGSWIFELAQHFAVAPGGEGFIGCSFWSQKQRWDQDRSRLNADSVVVVVHTHRFRLPSRNNIPLNPGLLHLIQDPQDFKNHALHRVDPDGVVFNQLKNAIDSGCIVPEYIEYAYNNWIRELVETSKNFHRVVHLTGFGFDELEVSLLSSNNNSTVITTPLNKLSHWENPQWVGGLDFRLNHLSPHNNQQLGQFLISVLDTVPGKTQLEIPVETWKFAQ